MGQSFIRKGPARGWALYQHRDVEFLFWQIARTNNQSIATLVCTRVRTTHLRSLAAFSCQCRPRACPEHDGLGAVLQLVGKTADVPASDRSILMVIMIVSHAQVIQLRAKDSTSVASPSPTPRPASHESAY
jgi:hypothetical protein